MYEIRECKQRTARENHVCDFCRKWIKKGSEYMVCKGQDDYGWFTEKRHIHCDAIRNYCESKRIFRRDYSSAYDAFTRIFVEVCMECRHNRYCVIVDEPEGDKAEIFTCEKAVAGFLPEGPIRNAALQSIKETKERPHYHD